MTCCLFGPKPLSEPFLAYELNHWKKFQCNWAISEIPECTCSISHNAPFRIEMCTFLLWMEHCGIWNRWSLVYLLPSPCLEPMETCPQHIEAERAAIFQALFWNGFSWIKMYEFRLEFHWICSLGSNYQYSSIDLTQIMAWCQPGLQETSHYLNQCRLVYWCIDASLRLNELIK